MDGGIPFFEKVKVKFEHSNILKYRNFKPLCNTFDIFMSRNLTVEGVKVNRSSDVRIRGRGGEGVGVRGHYLQNMAIRI